MPRAGYPQESFVFHRISPEIHRSSTPVESRARSPNRELRFRALSFAASAVWLATIAAVPTGQPVDGIHCDSMEGNVLHIHQHLAILRSRQAGRGTRRRRPAAVRQLFLLVAHAYARWDHSRRVADVPDVYAGSVFRRLGPAALANERRRREAAARRDDDGLGRRHRYAGDPRRIELTQHLDVVIDVGPPAREARAVHGLERQLNVGKPRGANRGAFFMRVSGVAHARADCSAQCGVEGH